MRIAIAEAHGLVRDVMRGAGHDGLEATEIADHLIDCELRGLSFGGLARAVSVVERIHASPVPRRPMRVVRETPCSATIDGGDQVGYTVAAHATAIAIAKAGQQGIAVVGAHNTWYTGMFSWYLERITQAGLVGLAAGSGPQMVAPHGGTEGRFGTNPIAFGFPSAHGPVIWDIGTSEVMHGEVLLAARLGRPLMPGLAFDRAGRPTRNPVAAMNGAFTVWGGHKGSGLALAVQLLGMLSGAAADPPGISDVGFFLMALDPGLLTPASEFRRNVTDYTQAVRAARAADPDCPVRVPFDRSSQTRAQTLAAGAIEVPDEIVATLRDLADDRQALR